MSPSGWLFHTSTGWLFHRPPVHQVILGPEFTMSRHVPSSVGPMLGSGICHRNRGGDVGLPSVPQYLSVTSNTSKHKTALVFVFERKIPSIAPYLALQENRDVTPAEITHGRQMETKGLSVPGVCGIVGKDLQSDILSNGDKRAITNPLKKRGLEVPQQLFTWCRASCVSGSRAG